MAQQQQKKSKGRKVGRNKRGKPYNWERNHQRRLRRAAKRAAYFTTRSSNNAYKKACMREDRYIALTRLVGENWNPITARTLKTMPLPAPAHNNNTTYIGRHRWYTTEN